MAVSLRRGTAALLDRLARRTPDVGPIVFDYPPDVEAAANLRAEQATRGTVIAGRVVWDGEPIPYTLTDKATA